MKLDSFAAMKPMATYSSGRKSAHTQQLNIQAASQYHDASFSKQHAKTSSYAKHSLCKHTLKIRSVDFLLKVINSVIVFYENKQGYSHLWNAIGHNEGGPWSTQEGKEGTESPEWNKNPMFCRGSNCRCCQFLLSVELCCTLLSVLLSRRIASKFMGSAYPVELPTIHPPEPPA